MISSKPDPSHFQKWKVAFRERAHLLISVGYIAGRYKIESDGHEEQDITGFIVRGMKDWMCCRDRPPWCKYYSVHEEAPVSKEGSSGKSRPRTDIFIELGSRFRPEYVFEAKRLRTDGYGVSKYTGLAGMGCFTIVCPQRKRGHLFEARHGCLAHPFFKLQRTLVRFSHPCRRCRTGRRTCRPVPR
jgi:hypothetical protein